MLTDDQRFVLHRIHRGLLCDDEITDADRLEAFDIISSGICIHCGKIVLDETCHCINDE